MDTDDLSEMAYACIVAANEITDVLKTELGAACSRYKTEDEYLKGILKHINNIEKETSDYLDEWNLTDEIYITVFEKKLRQLRSQIEKTMETPLKNRGKGKWVIRP